MMMVICPNAGSLAFTSLGGWVEWGGFQLPSSQIILSEQLVQGRYAVAWGIKYAIKDRHIYECMQYKTLDYLWGNACNI